jgi:hypothetical protein
MEHDTNAGTEIEVCHPRQEREVYRQGAVRTKTGSENGVSVQIVNSTGSGEQYSLADAAQPSH